MSQNVDALLHLVHTMLSDRELLLFLGAGSSTEGSQGNCQFPDFETLIDRVLRDLGLESSSDRWEAFLSVIRLWENESSLSVRLSEYLNGQPGLAHLQLAATAMSLHPEVRTSPFITTNFDDLMFLAFAQLAGTADSHMPKSFTVGADWNLPFQSSASALLQHARRGTPVILKLFGDLDSKSPVFHQDRMQLSAGIEQSLAPLFAKPALFIGYSLSDAPVLRFLVTSQSRSPVFVVSPKPVATDHISTISQRAIYNLESTFGEFSSALVDVLSEKHPGFDDRFQSYMRFTEVSTKFPTVESVRTQAVRASRAALIRHTQRDAQGGTDRRIEPVPRPDSGPDFLAFLNGDAPLLGIVGDSGSGKSTLMHAATRSIHSEGRHIAVFYDAHSLQTHGSLCNRISADFYSDLLDLTNALNHIASLLEHQDASLVIMIDALNESASLDTLSLRYEIEELAVQLPRQIKIAFSCRRVFWEANLACFNDIPFAIYDERRLHELTLFSTSEVESAYNEYRSVFDLRTPWVSLPDSVRQHVRDPLMLRFISEAYSGSNLPEIAPAVLVFNRYIQRIRERYKHCPVLDFLDALIDTRLDECESTPRVGDVFSYTDTRSNAQLHLLTLQQLANPRFPADPLVILEDEGLISPLDPTRTSFRFTYERFYEHLLGARLRTRVSAIGNPFQEVERFVGLFGTRHYSFYEGLKSAVVQIALDEDSTSAMPVPIQLIHSRHSESQQFGKSVFSELALDHPDTAFELLGQDGRAAEYTATVLDVAGDSERAIPVAVAGLFDPTRRIRVKSSTTLVALSCKYKQTELAERLFLEGVDRETDDSACALALCYFLPVFFTDRTSGFSIPISKCQQFTDLVLKARPALAANLGTAMAQAVTDEGGHFFGSHFTDSGLQYPWTEGYHGVRMYREAILRMLDAPSIVNLSEHWEAIRFFSSMQKNDGQADSDAAFAYQLEYRIVQWLLIRFYRESPRDCANLLQRVVDCGNHYNIDFALGVVEFVLCNHCPDDPQFVDDCLEKLRHWTDYFEQTHPEFFSVLNQRDPFTYNYVPLVMLCRGEAKFLTGEGKPVPTLSRFLSSEDDRRVRMALLACRWLSKEMPREILESLKVVANFPEYEEWIDRILGEIHIHSRRIVEDFMADRKFSLKRRLRVRTRRADKGHAGIQHDGERLYSALFLGSRELISEIHSCYDMIDQSRTLEDFCQSFVQKICADIV